MKTRWVTFDCFGTLVDWHTGFSAILSPLFGTRTDDVMHAYHAHEREVEAERPHRLYKDVLATALLRAATAFGLELLDADARRLPQAWASQPLFADVEEMLSGLRDMGCRLAVLTNCDEDLFTQTHRCFRQPFDLVITAERVRDYKPSLAHFRAFSEASRASPDDWVHVACSWYHDIAPTRALGIKSVWLDRGGTGEDASAASAHVRSAAAVCETVNRLYAPSPVKQSIGQIALVVRDYDEAISRPVWQPVGFVSAQKPMTFRPATLEDCALLAELNHQLIRDEGHRNPMNVAELEQRMRGWLSSGEYRAMLFEHDGDAAAYALFRFDRDSSIYLRQFLVCREQRRQGIGTQAVEILFREVFPARTRVTLDVLVHNEIGRGFWEATGFQNYSVCLERFTEDRDEAAGKQNG